jgi:hypothetical protein
MRDWIDVLMIGLSKYRFGLLHGKSPCFCTNLSLLSYRKNGLRYLQIFSPTPATSLTTFLPGMMLKQTGALLAALTLRLRDSLTPSSPLNYWKVLLARRRQFNQLRCI